MSSQQKEEKMIEKSAPTLIVFEGIEAAGKTTQAHKLLSLFLKNNVDCVFTKEPGGTEIGESIKDILFNNYPTPLTDLFLFLADRSQHINDIINPALQNNKIVICDRFSLSTLAYQSMETPLSLTQLKAMEAAARRLLTCCHTIQFVLDVPPETSFKRLKDKHLDRIELKPYHFYQHISEIFRSHHDLIFPRSHSFLIDATQPPNLVQQDILEKLKSVI